MSQQETILQFGGGKFLRGFADLFIHQANQDGQEVGRVVVVQSTESERARLLNAQHGRYHVLVRGLENGQLIDDVEESASISRALIAQTEWDAVLEVARSPHLRWILSNTTEAGLALDPHDPPDAAPPRSFPAKLLKVLQARFESGQSGLVILPTELLENNADRLRGHVLEQARTWNLPQAFLDWIGAACDWRNTLVDRIVTGPPPDHPLLETDALLITAEPFALFAIQSPPDAPSLFSHLALTYAPDVTPFFLRKVRILNAAHTAMVHKAQAKGIALVREAIADPEIADYLQGLLFDEIIPTLDGRVEEPEAFARQTLERFANPFQNHKISDIAVYHEAKIKVRLLTTRDEYAQKFGLLPPLLEEAINA